MRYSFIIPVYNRPDEVDELLQSLLEQTFRASKSSWWKTARQCLAAT